MTTEQMDWLDDERAGRHNTPPEQIGPRDFTVETLKEFLQSAGSNAIIRVHASVIRDLYQEMNGGLQRLLGERGLEIEQLKDTLKWREADITEMNRKITGLQSGTSRWISGAEASVLTLEEDQRTLQRAEAVELVTAMLAGAGFTLLRDPPGETAMWQQQLPTRPGVQVFFLLPVAQQELAPAELFAWVRDQVGVS